MKRFILLLSIWLSIISCKEEIIDFNSISSEKLKYPDFELNPKSWEKLDSVHRFTYADIHFCNEYAGIISGFSSFVLTTKDGGKTWATHNIMNDMSFHSIYALDENTFLGGSSLGIFKSTDGGSAWKKCIFPAEVGVFDIWFNDSGTGFLSSAWGTYKSTDAGETWSKVSTILSENLQFTSPNIGYFSSGYTSYPDFGPGPVTSYGKIFRTLDCGKTWSGTGIDTKEITALSFISDKVGFFTTYDGDLYKTADGGETCVRLDATLTSPTDIFFVNEQQGYLCSRTGLSSTIDGGKTFTEEYSVSGDNQIYKFSFPTPAVGFCYDRNGFLLKRIQN